VVPVSTITEPDLREVLDDALADLWLVEVLNDDVTTFEAVITALCEIFGHTRQAAERLAWQVHEEGSAVVAVLTKSDADAAVAELHRRLIGARSRPA
jgi:ATP-dependent Clp protease adapter protein ClpS